MVRVGEIMDELTVDYVKNNFHLLPIIDGIHETIEVLEKAGVIPIIVTTSNVLFAECFKEMYNMTPKEYRKLHARQ